jgi:integrase
VTWNIDPSTPFEDLFTRFVTEVESEIDEDTAELWELYGGTHFAPFFKAVVNFTKAKAATYSRERLKHVKRVTVQKELSVLRRFAAWCEEQGYCTAPPEVPNPPRRAVGTPYKVRRRGKPTELDIDEVRKLINSLDEWSASRRVKPFPIRARFILEFETTLRPATLSELSVPENYQPGARGLTITDEIDKSRFGRELPLTEEARAALDAVCPEQGVIFGEHDYRDALKKAAHAVLAESKAKTFTAYDLRHARLTQLAESGNLPGAAYLAGHRKVTTTATYVRPNRRAAERVLQAVGPTGFTPNPATARRGAPASRKSATSLSLCEGEDLNLHGSYPTSTSS